MMYFSMNGFKIEMTNLRIFDGDTFTRDLYDHLDGEAVVVILALQLLQDDRENGRCA